MSLFIMLYFFVLQKSTTLCLKSKSMTHQVQMETNQVTMCRLFMYSRQQRLTIKRKFNVVMLSLQKALVYCCTNTYWAVSPSVFF